MIIVVIIAAIDKLVDVELDKVDKGDKGDKVDVGVVGVRSCHTQGKLSCNLQIP